MAGKRESAWAPLGTHALPHSRTTALLLGARRGAEAAAHAAAGAVVIAAVAELHRAAAARGDGDGVPLHGAAHFLVLVGGERAHRDLVDLQPQLLHRSASPGDGSHHAAGNPPAARPIHSQTNVGSHASAVQPE